MPHKVTAPIARSTAYDFNCHLSLDHTRSRDGIALNSFGITSAYFEEDLNVLPHEILFAIDSTQHSKTQRMRCASSLNASTLPPTTVQKMEAFLYQTSGGTAMNLNTDIGRSDAMGEIATWDRADGRNLQRMNAILNEHIRYVGVAVTGCTGGAANALQRQGFSATRGGLMTVMNTGSNAIYPGQRVHMHLDIQDILGPKTKRELIEGISAAKIVPHLASVEERKQLLIDLDGDVVTQPDIYVGIGQPWPLMPLLAELVRERFPLRV